MGSPRLAKKVMSVGYGPKKIEVFENASGNFVLVNASVGSVALTLELKRSSASDGGMRGMMRSLEV
jgi:hypothetical protein